MNAYFVNEKPFFNVYLAYFEASKTNAPVQFKYFDEQFDNANWLTEPLLSFEQLMDARAHQLANKYDKCIFLYSGGYDSQTIFNVLNRNKIKVTEFIIGTSNAVQYASPKVVTHAKQAWWDKNAKFVEISREDERWLDQSFNNDEWLIENAGYLPKYSTAIPGRAVTQYIENKYDGTNYCILSGYEKHRLIRI